MFACTPSPQPGLTTTTVVSAAPAISSSTWPTPTVSTRIHGVPLASSTRIACGVAVGEAAELAARGHRTDEHAGIGGVGAHAHAVAEDGPAGPWARRVDREHRDRVAERRGRA